MDQQQDSPALANVAVILGFVVLLSTFATDSEWSVILGVVIIIAGGLWAGFAAPDSRIVASNLAMTNAAASDAVTPDADTQDADTEDERDDGNTA